MTGSCSHLLLLCFPQLFFSHEEEFRSDRRNAHSVHDGLQNHTKLKMRYYVEALTDVHGGESNVRHIGEYDSLEQAIAASQSLIDKFLIGKVTNQMTVGELFSIYQCFGEVPFIFSDAERTLNVTAFNHFKYAMTRCTELCKTAEAG